MMAGIGLGIGQSQRLRLNLGLTSAIQLLGLDARALTRFLEEKAAENGALRLDPPEDPVVLGRLPRWQSAFRMQDGLDDQIAAAGPSLVAHVLCEITRLRLSGRDHALALALVDALEPTGWLGQTPEAIARTRNCPVTEVEAVLTQLQGIEPAGLFARSLSECLRLQVLDLGQMDGVVNYMLVHLDLVAAGSVDRIAARCAVPPEEVRIRLRMLRSLNPKPGAQFLLGTAPTREPDLLARLTATGWEVELNRSALPALRIVEDGGDAMALRNARAIARTVEGRGAMLLRVAHLILMHQRYALERGTALIPMTMADIAEELQVHESTISRAVAGTSVDTPVGVLWLRRLFTGRVGKGEGPSTTALRAALAELIATENPAAPLTDACLVAALAERQMPVARRTVAKYRRMLNLPPAGQRRRVEMKKSS